MNGDEWRCHFPRHLPVKGRQSALHKIAFPEARALRGDWWSAGPAVPPGQTQTGVEDDYRMIEAKNRLCDYYGTNDYVSQT